MRQHQLGTETYTNTAIILSFVKIGTEVNYIEGYGTRLALDYILHPNLI